MCESCFKNIKLNNYKLYKTIENTKIYSVTPYKNEVKKAIRAIKYHKKQAMAQYFAKILDKFWQESPDYNKDFEIIPVPLHQDRFKERKYNHMELIAKEMAKITGYSVNISLVEKIKNTHPQYKLTRKQRIANLKQAFVVHPERHTGKKIIILDDICTTGVTIQEIIKELNLHGIKDIYGLVISNP